MSSSRRSKDTSKGKSKASSTTASAGTAWSEWTWADEYQVWYRARQDSKGEWLYDYEDPGKKQVKDSNPIVPTTYSPSNSRDSNVQALREPEDSGKAVYYTSNNFSEPSTNSYGEVVGADSKGEPSNPQYPSTSNGLDSYGSMSASAWSPAAPVDSITTALGQTTLMDDRALTSLNASKNSAQHIEATNKWTSTEPEDKSFRVHSKKYFQFGQVFKILWRDERDVDDTVLTESVRTYSPDVFVRRFVVVDPQDDHCIALPILVYTEHKRMPRIQEKNHAIVFTSPEPPAPFFSEKELRAPIRVRPRTPRDKLDPNSRLNFVKLYTVEYNVKVVFIGRVDRNDEQQLVMDYNAIHKPLPDRPQAASYPATNFPTSAAGPAYSAPNRPPAASYPSTNYPESSAGPAYGTSGYYTSASSGYKSEPQTYTGNYYDPPNYTSSGNYSSSNKYNSSGKYRDRYYDAD